MGRETVSSGQRKHKVLVYHAWHHRIQCLTLMKFNKHRTIEQPKFRGDTPLPSMDASHGNSWTLGVLKLALLKSWVFVLPLIFSVLRMILKSLMLWPLYPRLTLVVMLSSKSSQFVSSKLSNALFPVSTSSICSRKWSSTCSRNLMDDLHTTVLFSQQVSG